MDSEAPWSRSESVVNECASQEAVLQPDSCTKIHQSCVDLRDFQKAILCLPYIICLPLCSYALPEWEKDIWRGLGRILGTRNFYSLSGTCGCRECEEASASP